MRCSKILLCSVATGVVMSLAVTADPALAQAAARPTNDDVADIVVTAQRREQSVQDVPITIAVVSGDRLRDTQVTNLNDLGNRLSGVRINNAGASDSLNIRGVGSGFNMGFEQSVATFVDGVYLSRSQISRGGFLDIERIEVLKGPQSTYFGSNAIAGALSVTTRRPTENFEGFASALYGSHGEFDLQGAVGGSLGGGFSGRVAARYSGMDGYTRNLRLNNKGPKNDDIQGRVALRYEAPGVVDANLRIDYAKYDDKHSELQETTNCPPAPGYGATSAVCAAILAQGEDGKIDYVTRSGDSFFKLESVNASLNVAWTLGNHSLTSTTGYYDHDLFRSTAGGALLAVPALNMPGGLPISQPEKFHSFSQELRLESDKGAFIDYMIGAYYDRSNLKGGLSSGFYFSPFWLRVPPAGIIPANTPIAQSVTADQDQSNRSVFAALTVNASDVFRINLGARYSSILKKAHRFTRVGVGDAIGQVVTDFTPAQFAAWTSSVGRPAGDYRITRRVDDKFMPSINLQYDLTPDVMTYVSYSTGFKAGGWSIGVGLDTFEPETVKSYEAGIKASWFDRRLTTNITLFSSKYNNLQESTTFIDPATGVNQSLIANVAKSRSRGIDVEIGLRPVSGLNLSANVGYLDASYLRYPNAPCTLLQQVSVPVGCLQNLAGRPKAYAPKWSGSVSGTYSFDLSADLRGKLSAWVYFTSGFYQQASIDPLLYQSNYAKLDLRASIGGRGDRWELAVIAKNVTDKTTAAYRSVMPGGNAVSVRADRPRSVAAQLSTKF